MSTVIHSPKIVPFLWYDGAAEEAASFYVSLFDDSSIVSKTPTAVEFVILGQKLCAFNGGPHFKFTPAFSLQVHCEDQAEIDRLWEAFTKNGGEESRCGWIQDKYGLSWQIIPRILPQLLGNANPDKASKVREAMLQMIKLDISILQAACGDSEE